MELAVGNGRVAIPVAQATGQRVIGIDTSLAMLAQARARAAAAGVELDLREGDMRELVLEEPAALIYCPFRALLHLPSNSVDQIEYAVEDDRVDPDRAPRRPGEVQDVVGASFNRLH